MELTKNSARLIQATIFGAGVSVYYATPDFIRSRTGRFFAKSACLASITVANATIDYKLGDKETCPDCNSDSTYCDSEDQCCDSEDQCCDSEDQCCDSEDQCCDSEDPDSKTERESINFDANEVAKLLPESTSGKIALLSGLTGALAASTALEIAIERAIFRRGERRRAQGVTLAHSRFGLGLGLASGVFYYLTSNTEQDIVS